MALERFKKWTNKKSTKKDAKRKDHLSWSPSDIAPVKKDVKIVKEDTSVKGVGTFESPIQHNKRLEEHFEGDHAGSEFSVKDQHSHNLHDMHIGFNEEHHETIHKYKEVSSRFNTPLRTGVHPERLEKKKGPEHWEHNLIFHIQVTPAQHAYHVDHLDQLTSHKLTSDHVTFRGMTNRFKLDELKHGSEFIDHGFTGTTHKPYVAKEFSSYVPDRTREPDEDGYHPHKLYNTKRGLSAKHQMFRIFSPKGTGAYHLDRHENDLKFEHETLLHRGTKFKVGLHHDYDDAHVVDLHVMSQGHKLGDK